MGAIRFTKVRYRNGSLRKIPRRDGSVWEFRYHVLDGSWHFNERVALRAQASKASLSGALDGTGTDPLLQSYFFSRVCIYEITSRIWASVSFPL